MGPWGGWYLAGMSWVNIQPPRSWEVLGRSWDKGQATHRSWIGKGFKVVAPPFGGESFDLSLFEAQT